MGGSAGVPQPLCSKVLKCTVGRCLLYKSRSTDKDKTSGSKTFSLEVV